MILSVLSLTTVWAEDVEVLIEPKEAVVNESFFVTFKFKVSGDDEPFISFTPYGASVLGKRSQGISISTVVINGKFTTTKEQAIVYELQADRTGQAYLRNIKVELGGKTINLKEVRITVLNEPRRVPDVFMEAEASKTKVYIGEGIDVNYYLYYKGAVGGADVKEFPKLNKFIKRFHRINLPPESVQYRGQILRRQLAYSARLYPEKVGSAILDPMKMSIQIVENQYGGFGFGTQTFKNRDIASPVIDVEVLPLPSEGVPASFTGLVGEHQFSLSVPKNKFLINEPIEIKLEVRGKGALENFDAPVIFADKNLEQFDTKSEVTELGNQEAKKIFEYTLLARGPVDIAGRELALAYFDPSSGKYIEKKITVPALTVSGVAAPQSQTTVPSSPQNEEVKMPGTSFLDNLFSKSKEVTPNSPGLVGPVSFHEKGWGSYFFHVLNIVLALIITLVCLHWYRSLKNMDLPKDHTVKNSLKTLKKKGLNYPDLYKILCSLDKENKMSAGGVSVQNILESSRLSKEAKDYFKEALNSTEQVQYGQSSAQRPVAFNNKYFTELVKYL